MAAVIVKELVERLNLQVSAGEKGLDKEICEGYCGDLLSNVMGKAPESCIWLTVQTHQNIVAVAVLREMAAIVITGGYAPEKETQEKADMEGIPLLLWDGSAFDLAGRIYSYLRA
jgi:predicted transcriptional regulator